MPFIPAELNDYIIDFLHDDRATLKACGLVSRTWYPAAHYHLYRKVFLLSFQSCITYRSLLETSPTLGSFTHDVKISNALPLTPCNKVQTDNARHELGICWAFVFPALTAITRLELSFLVMHPALVSNVVQNLFTLTDLSLQYCRFDCFSDFATIFCSFPALQSCVLRGVSWTNPPANAHTTNPSAGTNLVCPCLTNLNLGRDLPLEELSQWLLAQNACTGLVQFTGNCSSERDALLIGELMQSASTSLKQVELDWYSSSYNDVHLPFGFALGPCTSLETLSLRCPIALHSTVPWVTSLLAQVNPARLKSFNLEIRLLGSLDDGLDWASLESRLLRKEFSRLTTVDVKVLVWHTASGIYDGVECAIRRLLPSLNAKGLLRARCH
ncbi:hypothetical protein BDY19DRAFT_41787 [Irpex rosettiformis]|uniref:Uncharacterized protein n=1 Tax=Irpex rosettiformis TaxID=378272 RepID=A0ACB8UKB2_9APHY|nr:hypothetical protein BDY19DRAFT_41787 [Irpex rosettiformis]